MVHVDELMIRQHAREAYGHDFEDHRCIGEADGEGDCDAIALVVVFGLLVYISPLWLVEREKCGP